MSEPSRRPSIRDPRTFVAVDRQAWDEACLDAAAGDTIVVSAGSGIAPWDETVLPARGVIVRATPPDRDDDDGPPARGRLPVPPWRYGRWVAGEGAMPARRW